MQSARAIDPAEWRAAVEPFERSSLARSLGQLATSVLPYLLLWVAMPLSLRVSYWLTLPLALTAAGFLVRSFIVCHDCGHGAFFRSRLANRVVGYLTGLIAFLPSTGWSQEHARHHAGSGNLDRRGDGDIWTLTVAEYRAASRARRLAYRLYRHPLVLLGLGPLYVFLLNYRFWHRGEGKRARWSKVWTNLGLAVIALAASLTIGLRAYLAIQLPVILLAGTAGIWLFYVQHQFEGTYWKRTGDWDYLDQALAGASFYRLPRLLQWLTGNIGYHHIHHLSPRVPNYFLQSCHESSPLFQAVPPLTLRASLRCLRFRLWDEDAGRLVGFAAARAVPALA
ncbi:fatty acid desaturase [bacterium]|nr:fatty acid desaturase [bacterium]